MKITISGSLGNIGKPLATKLVAAGHDVTVISSAADRKEAIEELGAVAVIGSVSDPEFLKAAFIGTDAVFAMTPPNMGGANIIANTIEAGKAFAKAIIESGVKRVVMLSSIGADLPTGNGPIAGLYHIEHLYRDLEDVSVTFLRAGLFYTNFYNDIPLIKAMGIMGANYPGTIHIPMVHPEDIATAASEELQKNTEGKNIRYIVSDVRTPNEVARIFSEAIGKPELTWVAFTDEQALQGMIQAGLPDEVAQLYTEMGTGFRNGTIPTDFEHQGSPVNGSVKLEDFAQTWVTRF